LSIGDEWRHGATSRPREVIEVIYEGKAWVFGNDVDTDLIIPARYLTTAELAVLAPHCLEDLEPEFARSVKPGDMVVAGKNFGCGSSREHAPGVLKALGVAAVVAESFARIFYRNGFNLGLPLVECPEAFGKAKRGDLLRLDLGSGQLRNLTRGELYEFKPLPHFMLELVRAGGLTGLLARGGWKGAPQMPGV
jgi:3-isopropylmalate/(R)-2-methylmalate dehydratase small subunit